MKHFQCWLGVILLALLTAPAIPTRVARAAGVVGDGTPGSCTEAALDNALVAGGSIAFQCDGAHTIVFTSQKVIQAATTIDGGSVITFSGNDTVSLFKVAPGTELHLDNLVLTNGRGVRRGGAIESLGTVVLRHTTVQNSTVPDCDDCLGAGIASRAGRLEVYTSRIIGNAGGTYGGGIASADVTDGGEFVAGGTLIVRDSVVQGNRSAGTGGGIYTDGGGEISNTLVGDNEAVGAFGGGIATFSGTLTLRNSVVEGNRAGRLGGGLFISTAEEARGTVTISDTHISGNATGPNDNDLGGGIYITGGARLTLARSTVNDNTAGGGAGLFSYYPETEVTIDQSTFSGNATEGDGGALWISSGTHALTNVTLSANRAGRGGGIFVGTGTSIDVGAANGTLNHVTLAGNHASEGASLFHDTGTLRLTNTIIAYPLAETPNCVFSAPTSALESGGSNVVDDESCALDNDGDLQATDPRLAELENNGGANLTHLPLATSPAIDAGSGVCPPTDQRDLARPQGAACDTGAVEVVAAGVTCGGLVPVVADTTISEADPDAAAGDEEVLHITRSPAGERRALLHFDLAGRFPPGSMVDSASLELPIARSTTPFSDVLEVVGLSAPWAESVTWKTQPPVQASYGTTVAGLAIPLVRIDLTTLVTQWATGVVSETSLSLVPGLPEMNLFLESRESGHGPRLVIRCAAAPVALPAPEDRTVDAAQEAAIEVLKATSTETVSLMLDHGAVRFADFEIAVPGAVGTDGLAQAEWFIDAYADLLRLPDAADLQLLRRSRDGRHIFFRQLYEGIPVYGAELGVHLDGVGQVDRLGGIYLPGLSLDAQPALDAAQAEALATTAAGDAAEVRGDTQQRFFNGRILGLAEDRTVLAWQVNLRGTGGDVAIFVDANTGAILFRESRVAHDFELDLETGNFTGQSDTCWFFSDDDDNWFDEDGQLSDEVDAEGQAAFNNIRDVYHFWRGALQRDSYDNDGEDILMYIHVDPHPGTASYNSGCDMFEYSTGSAVKDIIGHEFSHAIDANEAELIYSSQSGALDESFADIFGHAVDTGDWTIGEDMPSGAIRDMRTPSRAPFWHPDHMSPSKSGDRLGLRFLPPNTEINLDNDYDSVHTNSGIHNKVAFLLTDGGRHNGFNIVGLGQTVAQGLFYNVLTNCLWSSAQFIDARNCAVGDAQRLGVKGVCAVRNAYASVGLGAGDFNCDGVEGDLNPDVDFDGIADANDNCQGLFNPAQNDLDGDSVGNDCDLDIDGDAVCNSGGPLPQQAGLPPGGCRVGARSVGNKPNEDNCRMVSNPWQADADGDGDGDACDDRDGDSTIDTQDNCPDVRNDQTNTDGDSLGDACDDDIDGDGRNNAVDNCVYVMNAGQENGDMDRFGDACDLCPGFFSNDNGDVDRDGLGDACDPDADNDLVCNIGGPSSGLPGLVAEGCIPGARLIRPAGADNCPLEPNLSQLDMDRNGVGLQCDAAEKQHLGDRAQEYFNNFQSQGPVRVPIGVCPQCGVDYLPDGYLTRIDVEVPSAIVARVVDSNGQTVAKPTLVGGVQQLQFEPRTFTGLTLRAGVQAAMSAHEESPSLVPAPADTRYYLELTPGPHVAPGQVYDVQLAINGLVPGRVYLPSIRR